jgi:hypothetical protein
VLFRSIYFYDALGNIYKRTSGGTWSVDRPTATIAHGAAGQGMELMNNGLYYATATTIGRKWMLNSSPSYNDDFFTDGFFNLDQSDTSTYTNPYTLPVAIAETAANEQTFTPVKDPIKEIDVFLVAKGTGDWTITVHDAANNVIGTKTVLNASLVASGYQPFIFATPLRFTAGSGHTYHYHLTSTVADGTVQTSVNADLSVSNFQEYFGILVSDANWHPMMSVSNFIVIGNERYVAKWDESTYEPNRLVLPAGFNVRCFTFVDEFVVIGAWRGTTITASEESYLFFWDGQSVTYNFYIKINEGAVNALGVYQNKLFSVIGSSGAVYIDYSPITKQHQIPFMAIGDNVEVYPGAVTNFKNITHFGVGGSSSSSTLKQGVYQWGSKSNKYPDSLNMGYTISTGNFGSTVSIGAVEGIGNQLFISWKDGTSYGVDLVTSSNSPFATGTLQSLIFDNGTPMMEKEAETLKVSHYPLATNESIQLGYKTNRATSYTTDTANTELTDVTTKLPITQSKARFEEFQLEVVLGAAGTTSPTLTGISLKYDDLLPGIVSTGRKGGKQ